MPQLTTPVQDGFSMPAEWAPHQAVWMIWPYRTDNWRADAAPAQQAFAAVAKAISRNTPVIMGVPAAEMAKARTTMPAEVTLVEMESDDAWGGLNGGLYASWDRDQVVAEQVANYHHMPCYHTDLVLEGGSIHVDGEGTLLTTAECLLNPNRNPHLSKAQIEQQLREYLGVSQIIWLPDGVFNDETDGHIDNMCCFVRPGEVALHWTDDKNDPQYARSAAALKVLESTKDAQGRSLKVWKVPSPQSLYASAEETCDVEKGTAIERHEGNRLAGSYVNYLVSNQQIIYPLLDPATDGAAQALFEEMFPDFVITGVPAREILLGGGNIHCITQQIPR